MRSVTSHFATPRGPFHSTNFNLLGVLRRLRAIEAVERIGVPEARTILKTLFQGCPYARETRDTKASLARFSEPKKQCLSTLTFVANPCPALSSDDKALHFVVEAPSPNG
ncbi:hypothetical protein AYO40_04875 [Planctomycetaceae bacterium SCGC AG-212-D15]|nr:hypothetical protein AYO40_04875 [Planctomycetaceae bacterium SCGC AG-212-D15]